METLSSIIAEHILPFIMEECVHVRLSIQNKQLKRKRFNCTKDIFIPCDKIPTLLSRLEKTRKINGGMYIRFDKNYGQPMFGGSGQDVLLEEELSTFLNFPFVDVNSVKPVYDSILQKTITKTFLIYIVFSR